MAGHTCKPIAIGLVIASVMLAAVKAEASELRVTVTNVRSNDGEILIGLYENAKGFEGAIATAEKSWLMADRDRLVASR